MNEISVADHHSVSGSHRADDASETSQLGKDTASPEGNRPTVSIIIKAFNEERHIAAAIESALAVLESVDGEIILADGASTDRTVAIAQAYPIKIVRLNSSKDRSCGSGAQLGYQYSRGWFLCLMDGDMRLNPAFVTASIRYLNDNPGVAGVGGAIVDRNLGNLEYAQRARRFDPDRRPGRVTRLNGSAIYRRSSIVSVGYVTDRNIHGGEELELAARLYERGWTLARIDCFAADHYGHSESSYRLLLRRILTRTAWSPGEIMRSSFGKPQFSFLIRNDKNLLLCGLVAAWWFTLAFAAVMLNGWQAAAAIIALAAFPFGIMSWRWRSLRGAAYSLAVWNALALCFLPGLLGRRSPPGEWIPSTTIKDSQRTLVDAFGPTSLAHKH